MVYKDEGEVKDLVKKLERGELTKNEILDEMKRKGLYHHANEPIPGISSIIGIIAWIILCFLPVICKVFNLGIPKIPSIEIPLEIINFVFLFAVIMIPPLFYSAILREKRSITGDENIILVKVGAYRIVRHPAVLAGLILFIALSIIFTLKIPFTILSVFGDTAIFAGLYIQTWYEEKINIKKWGDEYRQYMKEVPRFNFILGIWRWAKSAREVSKRLVFTLFLFFLLISILTMVPRSHITVGSSDSEHVKVVSHSSYMLYESYKELWSGEVYKGVMFHVLGEIENIGSTNVEDVKVRPTFYDA